MRDVKWPLVAVAAALVVGAGLVLAWLLWGVTE